VASDRVRQLAIREGSVRKTGFIEPGDIMPVPGEAVPTQPVLVAEDMDGGRLLPERPLGRAVGNIRPSIRPDASQTTSRKLAGSPVDRAPNSSMTLGAT
jgi:hypothetical protein